MRIVWWGCIGLRRRNHETAELEINFFVSLFTCQLWLFRLSSRRSDWRDFQRESSDRVPDVRRSAFFCRHCSRRPILWSGSIPSSSRKSSALSTLQWETKATDLPQQVSLKQVLPVSPQLQEVWYYCVPTTVSMMLSARGIRIDQHTLARKMKTYEPYGTHNRDAIRILNRHLFGYEVPASGQSGYRLATVTNVDQAFLEQS